MKRVEIGLFDVDLMVVDFGEERGEKNRWIGIMWDVFALTSDVETVDLSLQDLATTAELGGDDEMF
ncbi:hypothetical protein, partial [Bacillus altitudinis]|uniref:hypothetical protein n=1 Tax=Bacillus altitudinis TaxID=293387 RepID=UPI0011A693FB